MKLPHREFLHLAAGAAALPAVSRIAMGADLSDAAGAHDRRLCPRRYDRHCRTPHRTVAVGATRPAIRHRESAGRGANIAAEAVVRAPRGRLHAPVVTSTNVINATLFDKLNFNFIRDIAPVAGVIRIPLRPGGASIGSGQDGSRVHRPCQGQPGQDHYGVAGTGHRLMWPANCSR